MKKTWFIAFWFLTLQAGAQDPLQEYLSQAAENNLGLQAKYTAFEASLERVAQASGLPDPTLSFGYFIKPVETRVGPQRMKFSLSQMFPWFGSLSAQGDAAAAVAQANYLQFIDAREKLMSELKSDYYKLWELQKLIKLESENLEILKSYQELTTSRISSGTAKLSDAYRVQIQMEESATRLKILYDQMAPLQRVFNRQINREVDAMVTLIDTIEVSEQALVSTDSLSHPSVAKYTELQKGAEFQSKAAKKSGLPKIGLGVDYVVVDERTDMVVPDNGNDVVMPMVSISLPIWRKQYSGAIKSAEFMKKQYQLDAQNEWDLLESKRDMQFYELQQANDEMKLYSEEITLVNKTLELVITDYTNDRVEFEEVLRLQQKLIQYKKLKLMAYRKYLDKQAIMEYLNYNVNEQ
ncbi:outer membrane protein [Owenweeksia hongkongensis DSM 17368]|uniref:Outer membrane protein n=1 Tax=Owenweeksia hongkongensis (strain DSM 17368 / CIP 108786 / JCM 12287 / NRRL B-23963 / UST20020801) TaxID=926562 RepID=G8QZR1_OWEHD|nr:TolC family protein [Owenweeksia hongkongensis]AEV31505.1 outer membrane protein [Owenweeksia hongkongensis DSM 17368]